MAKCLPTLLLLVAVGMLLACCFQSEQPTFPLGDAAAPFGDGGRYVVHEHVGGGEWRRQEVLVVTRRHDRRLRSRQREGRHADDVAATRSAASVFAGQADAHKDAPGYGYMVLRFTGSEAVLHLPRNATGRTRPCSSRVGVDGPSEGSIWDSRSPSWCTNSAHRLQARVSACPTLDQILLCRRRAWARPV